MSGDDDVKKVMKSLSILFAAGFITVAIIDRVTGMATLFPVAIT